MAAKLKKINEASNGNSDYAETYVSEFLRGYTDENEMTHTEFEFRDTDGTDEEAISRSNVKGSGSKVTQTFLERCIVRIGSIKKSDVKPAKWLEMIKSLDAYDQDYALMEIRKKGVGDTMKCKHICPSCNKDLTSEIDVDEFEVTPFNGESVITFELEKGYRDKEGEIHKTGTMRYISGLDREILEPTIKTNIGVANTQMLFRVTTSLGTVKNLTENIFRTLSTKDRQIMLQTIQDNMYGYSFETDMDCPLCGHTFRGQLSSVNFM